MRDPLKCGVCGMPKTKDQMFCGGKICETLTPRRGVKGPTSPVPKKPRSSTP